MTAILNLPSLPSVRDLCPATLRALPLDPAQLAALAAMRPADREYELERMIYAHLYDETCRSRSVARLRSHVDLALQAYWQEHREQFVARAMTDYERAALIARAKACAAGFDELGREVSADVTRMYAQALADGMPPALYSYQIAAQEQRLIEKRAETKVLIGLEPGRLEVTSNVHQATAKVG